MQKIEDKGVEVLEHISGMKRPLVVHHYECDGITSGSIVINGLKRIGKGYSVSCIRKIDDKFIQNNKDKEEIIFVDIGASSSGIDELKGDIVVIDHHQMLSKNHLHINPHMFGFDGGTELSASGTAYFVFKTMEDIAIVGAIGDIQYPLIKLNRYILEKGQDKGIIKTVKDIILYGKASRPLPYMLSFSDEPVIPMITGRQKQAVNFLESAGIEFKKEDKLLTYYSLPEKTRKRLIGALIEYLSMWGRQADKIIGEVYLLPQWPANTPYYVAQEFATVLNACGRNGREDIGVRVCLKDKTSFKTAEELLMLHKANLRKGIEFAKQNIVGFSNFNYLDGRGVISETIIGVVIGMMFATNQAKPFLGIAEASNNEIKVSCRALKKHNVNLGQILSKVCKEVNGTGGGHAFAAGATISKNKLNEFLIAFDSELSL